MSGFLAVQSDGPIDMEAIDALLRAGWYRGKPRVFTDESVVLAGFGGGLCVTDDLVVALDARLDGITDPAAHVVQMWRGKDPLNTLHGDFAGAVYDRRAGTLTVFRDQNIGRPALLARSRTGAVAASALAMLLADPGVERDLDEQWIEAYLTGAPGFATATGYRAIARLQPGHRAEADVPGWKQQRWFDWNIEPTRARDDRAYADGLKSVLSEAVRERIEGANRVGISLSGGLDSTSIAATARAVRPDADLVAIAVPFEAPRADERALQALVAQKVRARLVWAPLDSDPFDGDPRAMLEYLGAPPVAPNHFFVTRVVRAGAEAGIDVALDGIDGDAAVGGNWTYLSDLLVRGRIASLACELRAIAQVHGTPRKTLVRAYVLDPLKPPGRPGRNFRANELLGVSPNVAPAVIEAIDEAWVRAGVQPTHPFLDHRVMQYCLGLPRTQKVRAGWTKVVLRNAMKGLLPPEVTERAAKAELGSAFFDGLNGSGRAILQAGLSAAAANPSSEGLDEHREGLDGYRIAFTAWWKAWAAGIPMGEQHEGATG